MTRIEKLMELRNISRQHAEQLSQDNCPKDFGIADTIHCSEDVACCEQCWNGEIDE